MKTKKEMYKTAIATVSCAVIKAGEYVSLQFSHYGNDGKAWYYIFSSENGPLPYHVAYPENHLSNFCL